MCVTQARVTQTQVTQARVTQTQVTQTRLTQKCGSISIDTDGLDQEGEKQDWKIHWKVPMRVVL